MLLKLPKIIIDTDPGVDDALAISLACFSKLDILGICTVYGNASIVDTTRNALTVLQLLRKKTSVYRGESKPLMSNATLAESHGKNGLGGFYLKEKINKPITIDAVSFIKQTLEKNSDKTVSIVCIGPVTNLAKVQQTRPDLCKKINKLIILGGCIGEPGNITSFAEFNVYNDPLAFRTVINIDCEKILIPINICRKVTFTKEDFLKIKNKKIGNSFRKISDIYINYYSNNTEYGKFSGGVMYDLLAISYLMNRNLYKERGAYIDVITNTKSPHYGQTILKVSLKKNCNLVINIKPDKIKKLFFQTINNSI